MLKSHARRTAALAVVTAFVAACSSGKPGSSQGNPGSGGAATGSGGSTTGSGGAATGGVTGSGGSDAGGGAPAPSCDQLPAPVRSSGTPLELAFDTFFADQPFTYGEANALPGGTSVIPLNFRFYVSAVELTKDDGGSVPVDIVDDARAPVPYGVHLYNAEDATSHTLRVLAPPGTYSGVRFALGLGETCNRGGSNGRVFPLSDSSQLTWPQGFGYLFLRYEARMDGAPGGGSDAGGVIIPLAIHMGGDITHLDLPSANVIRLDGALAVPATGLLRKTVRVLLDQIFLGATMDTALNAYFAAAPPEMQNGERLRLNAPRLRLFAFGP